MLKHKYHMTYMLGKFSDYDSKMPSVTSQQHKTFTKSWFNINPYSAGMDFRRQNPRLSDCDV